MYSYSYYNDGSLMEVRNAQGAFVSSYTYNPKGLLNQATYVTAQENHTATNTWDTDGNRVGLTINGKVCSFVYDRIAGIPAVIQEVVDGTPVYYYRDPSGALIARSDATNGVRYYHFDALGSTRLLTDGDGDITDKYAYDAWGTVVAHDKYEGSIDQPYQYVGRLGYYTHYQDSGFKLLQLGVRSYDSETGRFTQQDAVKSPMFVYSYSNDKPLVATDPSGLYPSFVMGGSCRKSRPETQSFINQIKNDIFDLIDRQFPGAGMATCNVGITVNCSEDLGKCGNATKCGNKQTGTSVIISYAPACSGPKCLILHEAIHVCSGMAGGGSWPVILIPGCGNISAQHGPKWP